MPPQGPAVVVLQGTERNIGKLAERQHDEVGRRGRFVAAEEFAHAALDDVPPNGVSEAARGDDAQSAATPAAGAAHEGHVAPPGPRTAALNPQKVAPLPNPLTARQRASQAPGTPPAAGDEVLIRRRRRTLSGRCRRRATPAGEVRRGATSAAPGSAPPTCRAGARATERRGFSAGDGQAATTLRPPSTEHPPARRRAHPGAEPVGLLATATIGLKRTLHELILPRTSDSRSSTTPLSRIGWSSPGPDHRGSTHGEDPPGRRADGGRRLLEFPADRNRGRDEGCWKSLAAGPRQRATRRPETRDRSCSKRLPQSAAAAFSTTVENRVGNRFHVWPAVRPPETTRGSRIE